MMGGLLLGPCRAWTSLLAAPFPLLISLRLREIVGTRTCALGAFVSAAWVLRDPPDHRAAPLGIGAKLDADATEPAPAPVDF